jgi:hypothetical protein
MPLAIARAACAGNIYWKSSVTTGNWSNGNNWSATSAAGNDDGGVPSSSDLFTYIEHADATSRTITFDQTDTIDYLDVGNTGGGTDTLSQASATTLSTQGEYIGLGSGNGVYTQTAGTNAITGLGGPMQIAAVANSTGIYNLSGTSTLSLSGPNTVLEVGYNGTGTFNQGGGTNSGNVQLVVGDDSTGVGTYILSGGTLTGYTEDIGSSGAGTINQSGGVNVTYGIYMGYSSGAVANYLLSGSGSLTSQDTEYIGYRGGASTFTQSGGIHTDAGSLDVGDEGTGTYLLSSTGSLTVKGEEIVGDYSAGTFNQSGGVQAIGSSNYPEDLYVADSDSPGNYFLSGSGSLTAFATEYIGYIGAGTFNQTGGVHTIGSASSQQSLYIGCDSGTGTYLLSAGSLTVNGSVSVGSTSYGIGSLNISGTGSASVTGQLQILNASSGVRLSGGTLSVGSLTNDGTLIVSSGALKVTSGMVNNGSASFTSRLPALTTIDGTGSLAWSAAGNLTASYVRQGILGIGSISTITITDSPNNPGNNAATSILTDINNSGTLDLKNNDLIVLDTAQYTTVRALVNNAADGGAWDQSGITSSSAKANASVYGLGYAQASTLGSTSFDGQTFTDAVLVKYTLLGDTQLRGQVGIGDYDNVLSNFGTVQDWSGGNFHYGGSVGIGDYDDVLSNFGAPLTGNLAPALARGFNSVATPSLRLSPDLAKTDLKLEVNTITGDVYVVATAAAAFTGYTISDPSAHLLGGSTSPDPDKLLSVAAGNGGSTNVYETSGTYVDWFKITETASQVAEGQQQNGFGTHSSRDDTINIPAGGTIDFGDIYNTAAAQQDLTFDFAEAGTEPTNGPTYYGAEVDYISSSTPEPASASLLAIGALGMLGRRRRRRPAAAVAD